MNNNKKLGMCMIFLVLASFAAAQGLESWQGLTIVLDCPSGYGNLCAQVNPGYEGTQNLILNLTPGKEYSVSFWAKTASTATLTIYLGSDSGQVAIDDTGRLYNLSITTTQETDLFKLSADQIVIIDAIKLEEGTDMLAYEPEQYYKGCCPEDYCWNGRTCVEGQTIFGKNAPSDAFSREFGFDRQGFDLYVCDNGSWEAGFFKKQWFNQSEGYCLSEGHCWVNDSIGCINDSEYIEDFLCYEKDGMSQWTSRSKIVATSLLELANRVSPDDYSLYCDTYNNSLNVLLYPVDGKNALEYIGDCQVEAGQIICSEMYMNNFCVLNYGNNQTALGVSLNKPLDEDPAFFDLINYNGCSAAQGDDKNDGKFWACHANQNDKLWFNQKINSIIYAEDGVQLGEISFWESFFHNPFTALINFIVDIFRPEYKIEELGGTLDIIPLDFTKGVKVFNKLYVNVKGPKKILGVVERINQNEQFLSLNYTGYPDICSAIDDYNTVYDPQFSYGGLACNASGYIVSRDDFTAHHFPDLTAKLRVS